MKRAKAIFHKIRRVLAKAWLRFNPQITQVAITGSFGKTNTTRAIFQVLKEKYKGVMTDLNLDTIYNLPITALRVRPWHQFAVFELGVDTPGEMPFHLKIVKPKIGVLTGVTPVHADKKHLGSLEGIIKEKGHLLEVLPKNGVAILNFDDENVRKMAMRVRPYQGLDPIKGLTLKGEVKMIWYGTGKENCQLWSGKIKVSLKGLSFILNTPQGRVKIKTKLLGKHHVYTCMAAAAVGLECGLKLSEIAKGLNKLMPLKGRMNLEKGPKGTLFLNDALRANPASTIAGLEFLKEIREKSKIAVLGEMGELGQYKIKSHQVIGEKAADCHLNYLICVGPLQRYTAKAAKEAGMDRSKVFWVKDVREAAKLLEKILKAGDLWYLKGSLLCHMERVILLLEGKKVNCQKLSCKNYQSCSSCPLLVEC